MTQDAIVILTLLFAVVIAVVLVRRAARRRQDRRLAAQWDQFHAQARARPLDMVYVNETYQYARTGSKAIITWCETGRQQDTWFRNWHAPAGYYLLLRGSTGYGPHNANPNVLYVEAEDVHAAVPGAAAGAWERHRRRQRRRTG